MKSIVLAGLLLIALSAVAESSRFVSVTGEVKSFDEKQVTILQKDKSEIVIPRRFVSAKSFRYRQIIAVEIEEEDFKTFKTRGVKKPDKSKK